MIYSIRTRDKFISPVISEITKNFINFNRCATFFFLSRRKCEINFCETNCLLIFTLVHSRYICYNVESNNDDKKGGDKGLLIRDQSEKMKSESNYYFFSALNAK